MLQFFLNQKEERKREGRREGRNEGGRKKEKRTKTSLHGLNINQIFLSFLKEVNGGLKSISLLQR